LSLLFRIIAITGYKSIEKKKKTLNKKMAENLQSSPGQLPTDPPPQPDQQPQQQQEQQKPPFRRVAGTKPKKGDLVGFRYVFWKHDPHPLVLVTSQYADGRIAGVNLHSLTLWDMTNLVKQYCNKANISYQVAIKGRRNIVKGFRTYKWEAMKDMILLDCGNFLSKLGIVREQRLLSPNEVEKLRSQIQQQLRKQINPRTEDLTKYQQQTPITPIKPIPGQSASIPGIPVGEQPGGE
jgi:hypothetical protein